MATNDFHEPRHQVWLKYFVIGTAVFLTASACQTQNKNTDVPALPPTPAPAPGAPRALILPKPDAFPGHFTAHANR